MYGVFHIFEEFVGYAVNQYEELLFVTDDVNFAKDYCKTFENRRVYKDAWDGSGDVIELYCGMLKCRKLLTGKDIMTSNSYTPLTPPEAILIGSTGLLFSKGK